MDKKKNKRTIIMTDTDRDIMAILYKLDFATERQISVMVGEPVDYVKGRCKQLCEAGWIERSVIRKNAVNSITKKGITEVGFRPRNVHEPKLSKYEHSLGFADTCAWLSMWRRFKDGSYHSWIPFGCILTERDFNSVREMSIVKYRNNGQPVYVSRDKDIHAPDGYIIRSDGTYVALEFERTHKSSSQILRKNILENCKRFRFQYWFYDDLYVGRQLETLKSEIGDKYMAIYDIRKIRQDLDKYVESLPTVISKKSGVPRRSCLGKMYDPIPLNRLPLLPGYQQNISLEIRSQTSATEDNQQLTPATPQSASTPIAKSGKPLTGVIPARKPLIFERR